MKKISIVGCGRLGLAFALICEQAGYSVMACDKRIDYVKQLNDKTFRTTEPEIEGLLKTSKNFTAAINAETAFSFSDLIFVFVPTPSKENGEYDHTHIEEVVEELLNYNRHDEDGSIKGKALIICCTTMPGYCSELNQRLLPYGVKVVYNPSFIAQGLIYKNLKNADIVLIGRDSRLHNWNEIEDIYKSIMDITPKFKIMSLTAAEITKISLNCFLTTKISFANRIAEICINSGIEDEVSSVLNTIGSDRRVGIEFLRYGYGFSGLCLPRDNRALGVHAQKVGVTPKFQELIDDTNNQHLVYLHKYFVNANPDKEIPFIFYQLSYKGGVDILTESQPLKLCSLLLEDGYSVSVIESESVIEQAKIIFKKYGNKVTYGENKNGFVINFG